MSEENKQPLTEEETAPEQEAPQTEGAFAVA